MPTRHAGSHLWNSNIHGVLEMTPAFATAVVAILNWQDVLSLFGFTPAGFALEVKRDPLPAPYLVAVLAGVVVFGVLPYGEELLRTLRQRGVTRARMTAAGS
jgi:hypothetical protein